MAWSKSLYWLFVGLLIFAALTQPQSDSVACRSDAKPCERLKECSLSCERCKTDDKCCCKHTDSCSCVDPTTAEPCCE